MGQLSVSTDLYAGSIAIKGTRLECRWEVIKVAPYLLMEICQMSMSLEKA